jgi:uncharacterized protein (TIGR02611 family)
VKRVVVAVLGGVLTLIGIALLVLPGPGFLLVAAGLTILATQFDWARKPLDYAKGKAEQGIREVGRSRWRTALALLGALAIGAVGVLDLCGVSVPFVNTLSAVLLVLSGLFLLATLVWARALARRQGVRPAQTGASLIP